jgi:hypothetical protein
VAEGQLNLLDGNFPLVREFGEGSSNVVRGELEPDFGARSAGKFGKAICWNVQIAVPVGAKAFAD